MVSPDLQEKYLIIVRPTVHKIVGHFTTTTSMNFEDISSEANFLLISAINNFKGSGIKMFVVYARRVVWNGLIDMLRRHYSVKNDVNVNNDPLYELDMAHTPMKHVEDRLWYEQLLSTLPTKSERIIRLRFEYDMTWREIAFTMGYKHPNSVYNVYSDLIKEMRKGVLSGEIHSESQR